MKISIVFLLLLWAFIAHTQPQANFSSNQTSGCTPFLFQFNDLSTSSNSITHWEWYVNDTLFSINQDPALYINYAGTHKICLKVTNQAGQIDSLCIEDYLTSYQPPNAAFVSDQQLGCLPLPVQFTDQSTLGDAPIQEWRWDFGDGQLDTINQHPSHVYGVAGNLDVTLSIMDTNGCQSTELLSDYMTIRDTPKVSFTQYPTTATCQTPPTTVNFGASLISGGAPLQYTWDFGDNQQASSLNTSHSYQAAGVYSVKLDIQDAHCSSTVYLTSKVTISEPPSATFTIDEPIGCQTNAHIATFTHQTPNISSRIWNFGHPLWSSTDSVASQYYPDEGFYPISLQVTNIYGCTNNATDTVIISDPIPTFDIQKDGNCAPVLADFSGMYANKNSSIGVDSWFWRFGDGTDTTTQTGFSNHYYPDSGDYQVTLIVTDEVGCQDSLQRLLLVGIPPQIDSTAVYEDTICRQSMTPVAFWGSDFINTWWWIFTNEQGQSKGYKNAQNIQFGSLGMQYGELTVAYNGCRTTINIDSVFVLPPLANFEPDCGSLTVQFTDLSAGADEWHWTFGDPTTTADTSILSNPSYTYPASGMYFVTLEVTNHTTGCIDVITKSIWVGEVEADFIFPDTVCLGEAYWTQNLSLGNKGNRWQSTDAFIQYSGKVNSLVQFNTAGVQSLTLRVGNGSGCWDTITKQIYVSKVEARIQADPPSGCIPYTTTLHLDSSVSLYAPLTQYQWSTGDTTATLLHTQITTLQHYYGIVVENALGCQDSALFSITGREVVADFSVSDDLCIHTDVPIIDQCIKDSATLYYYHWDFGNGDQRSGYPISYQYPQAGNYFLQLTLTDSMGCTLTTGKWVTIHDPQAQFSATSGTYSTCPPLEVNFNNLSTGATSWHWSFGNMSVSNQQNPSHVYSTIGNYDVKLIATAFLGCSDTFTLPNFVTVDGPSGQWLAPDTAGCAPLDLQFVAQGNHIAEYTWLLGDGNFVVHPNATETDTLNYTYLTQGNFVPRLILTDSTGCSVDFEGDSVHIYDLLIANFQADSLICEGDSMIFIPQVQGLKGNENFSWVFETAQGYEQSNVWQPEIVYDQAGTYDVQFMVQNQACADTILVPNFLEVEALPTAAFSTGNTPFCEGDVLHFQDISTSSGTIEHWHWQFGNGEQAYQQQPNGQLFAQAGTYENTLWVETQVGCQDSIRLPLTVSPNPLVDLGEDPQICLGESLTLTTTILSDSINLTWIGEGLAQATQSYVAVQPTSQESYILQVQNSAGCQSADTILVKVNPLPNISINGVTTICEGESTYLNVSGASDYIYTWLSPNNELSCVDCLMPLATPTASRDFVVQAVDSLGCSQTDTIGVEVRTITKDSLPDRTICRGNSLAIGRINGATPRWQGTDLSCSECPEPIVSPTENTVYAVAYISPEGCEVHDSMRVEVIEIESFDAGGFQTMCIGDTVALSANVPADMHLTWIPETNLQGQHTATPRVSPTQSTIYTLLVGKDACVEQDQVKIEVENPTHANYEQTDICAGDTTSVPIQTNARHLEWTPRQGVLNTQSNRPFISLMQSQTYQVIGHYEACKSDTMTLAIKVHEKPSLMVEPYIRATPNEWIYLDVDAAVDNDIQWHSSAGNEIRCSDCPRALTQVSNNGFYWVNISDEYGCETSDSLEIELFSPCEEHLVHVPNAFSPNQDGVNDRIRPRTSADRVQGITEFSIYDRWGNRVFVTKDIKQAWDGTFKGQPAQVGVYVYYLTYPCPYNDSEVVIKGDITLVR